MWVEQGPMLLFGILWTGLVSNDFTKCCRDLGCSGFFIINGIQCKEEFTYNIQAFNSALSSPWLFRMSVEVNSLRFRELQVESAEGPLRDRVPCTADNIFSYIVLFTR